MSKYITYPLMFILIVFALSLPTYRAFNIKTYCEFNKNGQPERCKHLGCFGPNGVDEYSVCFRDWDGERYYPKVTVKDFNL